MSVTQADAVPTRGFSVMSREHVPLLLQRAVYVLLVLLVLVGFASTPAFRSSENLISVLRSVSLVGIAALGVAFVTLAGSFVDLSVAAIVSVAGVVTLAVARHDAVLAVPVALLVALAIGALNGFFVGRFGANPILLTLASTTIAGGALLVATQSKVTYGTDTWLKHFANAKVATIPATVIVLLVLAVACQWALAGTTWGRRLLAVGTNERTARFTGLNVGQVRMTAFMLSGLFAGVTGVLLAGNLGSATPTAGTGYEFDALTAVIVGGARLTGGKGSALGTLAGAVLVGVLSNLLVLWGAPYSLQQVVKGLLLVIVVAMSVNFGRARG